MNSTAGPRAGRVAGPWPVVLLAILAAAARLPFLGGTLSPDEGGFLMVAGQWDPGTSLYGDYWVDRPPLLIGIFGIAARFGDGALALRVVGMVAVALAVVLAGLLGRTAVPERRWAPIVASATAAVFLSTPLFGVREVDGELLAAPFVLAGLLAVLRAAGTTGRSSLAWWAAAGVLAVAAIGVKQSMADVAVAGLTALLWQWRAHGWRRTAYAALAAAAAGLLALAAMLGWAASHGTGPRALWDAVVAFRMHASTVIAASATGDNDARANNVAKNFLASGAASVLLVPLLPAPRARVGGCLPVVAAAVCAWETVGILAGGSYWWHYLIGLVPGLVLVAVAVMHHRPRLAVPLLAALGYAAFVTIATGLTIEESGQMRENALVADYLREHAGPHDTGVTAFGNPAMLQAAGLRSPYENLWSLPVRVRDPDLRELTRVLSSADRPTWFVTDGDDIATWGIDATEAQPLLDRHYRLVGVLGDWHVFHVAEPAGTLRP